MNSEQQIRQARYRIHRADAMVGEAAQLDAIAAQLMAMQRQWNAPDREARLAAVLATSRAVWHGIQIALAEGALAFPLEVRQNLLILSVYADSKIGACELAPSADTLGSLIALTHTLAGSLREWREAA